MKPRIERCTRHFRGGEKRHILMLVQQPRVDYWKWRAYHWYDMKFPIKVPGWKRWMRFLERLDAEVMLDEEGRWRDKLYGWDIAQDLRCYELSVKNKTVIGEIEVSEEVFKSASSKGPLA